MNREDLKMLGMFECIQYLCFISDENFFDKYFADLEAVKESGDVNEVLEAYNRLFEQYELLTVVLHELPERLFEIECARYDGTKEVYTGRKNKLSRKLPNYFDL